jgi:transcriptional regulator with XRE-family HTH domain
MPPGAQPPRSSASIGAVIRRSRAGRYTLAQLAQQAGVSSGLLSLIERGQGNPSLETLRRIASALDVAVVELLAAADGVTAPGTGSVHGAGSVVQVDGSVIPDGRSPDGEAYRAAAGGWQTSMVLGRGQEARVRVLDGSLELRLREIQEPRVPVGPRPALAVDLEVRAAAAEPDAGIVEIPPVSDPRWMELVNGSIPFQPTELGARMLFTHVTRCIGHDPSSPNVDRWVSELRGYFVKYEAVSKPELKRIFG